MLLFWLRYCQFEEIFTLGSQEEERQRFIELLTQISEGQLAIVTTMRADFLEYCLNYKSLTQLIQEQAVYMPPLLGAELEEAIVSLARLQGYRLQRGLFGAIQQEVSGQEKGCLSRWALKNTTKLRNVNCLKAYIQSLSSTLHKFT